jgi:hypothetical protein
VQSRLSLAPAASSRESYSLAPVLGDTERASSSQEIDLSLQATRNVRARTIAESNRVDDISFESACHPFVHGSRTAGLWLRLRWAAPRTPLRYARSGLGWLEAAWYEGVRGDA